MDKLGYRCRGMVYLYVRQTFKNKTKIIIIVNKEERRERLKELLIKEFRVVIAKSDIRDETELIVLGIDWYDMLYLAELIEDQLNVYLPYCWEKDVETFGDLVKVVEEFA